MRKTIITFTTLTVLALAGVSCRTHQTCPAYSQADTEVVEDKG